MILVDSSVWIDYFRSGNAILAALLDSRKVMMHPFVVGEIALGNLRQRGRVLGDLESLPTTVVATHREVLHSIRAQRLWGLGIGYVDAHLLAAVQLTSGAFLWTLDMRLLAVASRLGVAATLLDKPNGSGGQRF